MTITNLWRNFAFALATPHTFGDAEQHDQDNKGDQLKYNNERPSNPQPHLTTKVRNQTE